MPPKFPRGSVLLLSSRRNIHHVPDFALCLGYGQGGYKLLTTRGLVRMLSRSVVESSYKVASSTEAEHWLEMYWPGFKFADSK